ncbi:Alcohol dehydrogenase-like 4 [Platanthera guangdongensis]|uniref:Alcohol dehydrogenase-like 4 n=1 Tax=Platanthera guangdongensis TaxID=2320717 RepID=A0ABR2LNT7_9ASPA
MAGFSSDDDSNGFHDGDGNKTAGKVIKCKAAVVWAPGEPFMMEEIEVEAPRRLEVRLRILFTSICHTDLTAWMGENESQRVFPRVLGHEAAGVVESIGEGVEDLRPGDRVVPVFNGECGDCAACRSSKTNLCCGFAVDPNRSVMRSDGRVRFYCAGRDGVRRGVGAAWNAANVDEGSKVAIFGLGAVGLAVAEGARLRGAAQIIGVDINTDKFVKGREMGITEFVNPQDYTKSVHEVVRELSKGGVDYSFECSGNLDVLRQAFLSTHKGWGLTVVLGIHPSPRMLPLHPMELFERKMVASVFGDFKPKSQLPDIINKWIIGANKINLDGFITHELPFTEINQAFQLLSEGKALRCLLKL